MPSEDEPLLFDLEPASDSEPTEADRRSPRGASPSDPLDLPLVLEDEHEDEFEEPAQPAPRASTPNPESRVERPPTQPAQITPPTRPTQPTPPAPASQRPDPPVQPVQQVRQASLTETEPAAAEKAEEAGPGDAPQTIAPLRSRFVAGLLDLSVSVTVTISLLLGILLMGIQPRAADWPALATFLLVFSFLYTLIPLAFWGQTPGMASAGLYVRSLDGQHLNLLQTLLRWVGTVLTCLGLGLPTLLVLSGGSLSDRISKTVTFLREE